MSDEVEVFKIEPEQYNALVEMMFWKQQRVKQYASEREVDKDQRRLQVEREIEMGAEKGSPTEGKEE